MKELDSVGRPELGSAPLKFDGAWLIRRTHEIGAGLGFERVRTDRGADPHTGRYYEVGYGPLKIVTVTGSTGTILEFTAETWDATTLESRIEAFLRAVREHVA